MRLSEGGNGTTTGRPRESSVNTLGPNRNNEIVFMLRPSGHRQEAGMEPDSSDEDDPGEEPVEPVTRSQAEAILEFYHTYERAPTRRGQGQHGVADPEEPNLAMSLYYLRRTAAQNKVTESVRLLREGAPELLEPVKTMEQKATNCVTYLKSNPSSDDPQAKKWWKFIANCKQALRDKEKPKDNRKKRRAPTNEVYRILAEGLPGCLDSKRPRRGTSRMFHNHLCSPTFNQEGSLLTRLTWLVKS